jgi:hypothetical protein
MDKCVCSNNATLILPCNHKICSICLHNLNNELICNQCYTSFKQEDVIEIISYNNDVVEICPIHNEEYVCICECDKLYCKNCDELCDSSHTTHTTIGYYKKQSLLQMKNLRAKLNNQINGLNCIIDIIILNHYSDEVKSIIKQFEDIIDTMYMSINHIDNFNQLINNLSISNIIKRKNQILNNKIVIPSDIISINNKYVNIILKNECYIGVKNNRTLSMASSDGNLDIVKCVIKNGVDIHADNEDALRWASQNGHLAVVEYLISHGADVHANNDDALIWASLNGHLAVVKCLISHGADIQAIDNNALRWASIKGHLDIVECLIDNGANIHDMHDHALRLASREGNLAIVKYLIAHGADIHTDNDGALIWASEKGHKDIVECLIKHGANITVLNQN